MAEAHASTRSGTIGERHSSRSRRTTPTSFRLSRDQEAIIRVGHYLEARKGFASDSELAQLFPVSRSRISRWKRGEQPGAENARILRDLATVVARLLEYYDEESIPKWLRGRNPDLGGRRPLDLIREGGHLPEILSVIEAQTGGAFA
jgi:hypothetical protein